MSNILWAILDSISNIMLIWIRNYYLLIYLNLKNNKKTIIIARVITKKDGPSVLDTLLSGFWHYDQYSKVLPFFGRIMAFFGYIMSVFWQDYGRFLARLKLIKQALISWANVPTPPPPQTPYPSPTSFFLSFL